MLALDCGILAVNYCDCWLNSKKAISKSPLSITHCGTWMMSQSSTIWSNSLDLILVPYKMSEIGKTNSQHFQSINTILSSIKRNYYIRLIFYRRLHGEYSVILKSESNATFPLKRRSALRLSTSAIRWAMSLGLCNGFKEEYRSMVPSKGNREIGVLAT